MVFHRHIFADGNRPGAFAAGLVALAFLTLFPCAGYAQLNLDLQLEFTTPSGDSLQVPAGGTAEVEIALVNSGLLESSETVTVTLTAETLSVNPSMVTLTATADSTTLTIDAAGVAAGIAGSVTATGVVLSGGSVVENTSVGSATLVVEVLPRRFALRFETPEGTVLEMAQVVAGRTTEVQVVLANPDLLESGESVRVTLTAATVNVVPPVVTLAETTPRITLSIEAAVDAVAEGTVEATGVVLSGGSAVENTSVSPATLAVEVVARRFRLSVSGLSGAAFAREEISVVDIPDNSREQSVRSTISVEEGITIESLAITVSISHTYISDLVVTLIPPEGTEVVLHDQAGGEADDIRQVYASVGNAGLASLTGESARGDWILTVGDHGPDDEGRLESWGLYVNPSSTMAQVVAGGSATVLVELAGMETPFGRARLLPGETVSVTLTAETVSVVPPVVTLAETTPRITLSIEAAVDAVAGGTVEAAGVVLSGGSAVENTSVSPATLAVEVLPRRFALRFETPEGTVLEMARVVAGSTTEVAVVLTDAEALGDDEEVPLTLTAEGVGVSVVPSSVTLTVAASSAMLTIDAAVDAMSGTLTAEADTGDVMYIVVESATLAVTILPRDFALRFETLEGEALTEAEVVAGSTAEVAVVLESADLLGLDEAVPVTLTAEGVGVSMDMVALSMAMPRAVLTIDAAVDAMPGSLTAEVGIHDVMNAVVEPAGLRVTILPRRFSLRFETPEGAVLETAWVTAGRTTEVAVVLESADLLGLDEAVPVTLTAVGVGVSMDMVALSMAMPRAVLTIDAAVDAMPGSLTAEVGIHDVMNAMVEPATLPVAILPREFALRFETLEGEALTEAQVVAGSTAEVAVALTNAEVLGDDEEVPLTLTLTAEGVGVSVVPSSVTLTVAASSAMLTINAAVDAMSGTLMAGANITGVMNAVVAPATLAVAILPREFALRFETLEGEALTEAQVVAGSTADVAVALTNAEALEPGETVSVTLTATPVSVVSPMVTLTEAMPKAALTIDAAGFAAGIAGSVTATGVVLSGGFAVDRTSVDPATLAVEVVLRRFALRFETPEGAVLEMAQVVAGSMTSTVEVAIALTNAEALNPGETVPVTLMEVGVRVSTDMAVLSMAAPRATLTIDATGFGVGIAGSVTATGVVLSGGSAAENTSVDPATLTVSVVRELILQFETLSGEALTEAQVVAGSMTDVAVALTNAEALEPNEAIPVTLTAEGMGVGVDPSTVTLTAAASSAMLTIDAAVDAMSETLTAQADISGVMNAMVEQATLAVEVLPRRFALRFETLEGEALTEAQVVAGSTTDVAVALTDAEALESGEEIPVTLTAEMLGVDPPTVTLTAEASSAMLTINAAVTVTSGTLMAEANITGVMNAVVAPATLAVAILPRRFALRFETLEGEALTEAQVVAGSTTDVAIALTSAEALEPGEEIPVTLTAEGVGVSMDTVVLSMTMSQAMLTIDAAVTVTSGTLMAEANISGVMNAMVEPTTLAVVILPRRFALRFETLEGEALTEAQVVAGSTTDVAIALTNAEALEAGEGIPVTLTAEMLGVDPSMVALTAEASSAMLTIDAAVTVMSGTLMAEANISGVMNAMVEPATLAVEVLPRRFGLRFETPSGEALSSLEVVVDATTEVAIALTNADDLEPGETVSVTLMAEGVGVSTDMAVLSVTSPRATLTVDTAGVAAGIASVTATGEVLSGGSEVESTLVDPATLAVEVLPRRFGLRFETPEGAVLEMVQVVAGSMTSTVEVAIALTNADDLEPGETVSVTLTTEGAGVSTDMAVLSVTSPRATLTVNTAGVAAGTTGSVTATGTVLSGGSEVGSTLVDPATLTVSVVRELILQFETLSDEPEVLSSVEVVAGAATQVAVTLTDIGALEPGESVSVTLTAIVQELALSAATPRITLRVGAAADAVAGGTVEATGVVLLDGAMVARTQVRPATLAVEVLPRRFTLRFETPEGAVLETAQVTAGSMIEAALVLTNAEALEFDEEISVTLTAEGVGVSVSMDMVALSMTMSRAVLTINAAVDAMSETLTATPDFGGVTYIVVEPATLPVEVLPRDFALRFETPEGTALEMTEVTAGSMIEVAVVLEGADLLESNESIPVTLTADTLSVNPSEVMLTAAEARAVLTIDAAVSAMSEPLTAEVGTTNVMNVVVEPAILAVTVVPRRFALRFETPEGAVLETARVAAGITAEVAVVLTNVEALESGETVSVTLTATPVSVVSSMVTLTEAMPKATLTIDAAGLAADTTGSVTATGEVMSGGSAAENASVDPATLAVEIVLRRFALRFETPEGTALETIRVTAGNTTEVVVALTNVEALRFGETVPVTLTTAEVGVSTNAAVLSMTTPRTMLTVDTEGVAADVTGSVTAIGEVLSDGSVVGSTSVDPATLAVEVLLRRFALRFETPEGTALETIQVTAGNTTEVVVVLTNVEALRSGETVPVTLTTAEVGVSTNAAVLSVTTPRAMLTVDTEGVAADVTGSVTATGVVVLSDGSAAENTSVDPATLAVEVLLRRFALRFETPEGTALETIQVTAGNTTEVVVVLTNVEALRPEETVPVTLTTAEVGVSTNAAVLSVTTPRTMLTVDTEGVAADVTGSVTATGVVVLSDGSAAENTSVDPATLAVEVLPRRLALRFETPEGAVLETAQVTAGSMIEVAIVLENAGALEPDEEIPVTLTAATLSVLPPMVTLAEATPRVALRINAAVSAMSEPLMAEADIAGIMNAVVEPTTLAVEVLPRRFALRFETLEGAMLGAVRVTAGRTTEVVVVLENAEALESGETVPVTLTVEEVDVSTDMSVLSMTASSAVLTISAAVDVMSGTLTADADITDLPNAEVELTTLLPVTVLPRRFALRFETPEGAVLETAQVTAGSATEVAVVLENADSLVPGETVPVTLAAETLSVNPSEVMLTAATARVVLTIDAAVDAMSGTLTAEADTTGLVNARVEQATLPVTVLPRRFALRFETPEGAALETARVTAGSATEVEVVLENPEALVPGETVPVTLTAETLSVVPPVVMLTEATPRVALRIVAATTAMSETLTAQADTTGLMNAVVQSATLAVTVLPAPVNLQLMFDPPTLTVARDRERMATLSLEGVPAGAAVTVALSVAATATVQVVTESVTFTATTQSHAITIRGVAEGSATLTAMVDADALADLPSDSTVESAQLPVTVVPAVTDTVMLQLAFEPPTLTVAVGSEESAMLQLLGEVPPGVAVTVALSTAAPATAQVVQEPVTFSADETRREVTVLGVAAGSVAITAAVSEDALEASGLPAGSSVASTDLAVTVVLPTVDLQLAFEPPTLTVITGSTATAMLRLEGVPATGAAVTVELSVADEATAEVTPAEVIFSEANPDTVVTLTGVAAGDATVTAVAVMLDGLSNASTVRSAQLAVTVVQKREFALGFETPGGEALTEAQVMAGGAIEVVVVLGDADLLVPDEAIPVTLTAEGMGVSVDLPEVTLAETTPRATLRIVAMVNATSGTLTAEADTTGLINAMVEPATLAVAVLPRRFALRFETPEGAVLETARVTVGSTAEVVVALTNIEALRSGETVPVTLTTAEVGVSTNAAVLSVTTPRAMLTVDTEGVVADVTGSVTATGVVVLSDGSAAMNTSVDPATLAVEILPRRLALRFETPEGAVLEAAQVTAGSATEVAVVLGDADLLEPDEAIPVTLTAEGVGVSSDVPVLSVTTPRVMLTIAAAVDAMSGTLTAEADTAGLINVAVRPATLAVEILPRRFALRFETPEGAVLETAQVTAGRTTEVAVVLENADLLVPGETVTVPVTLTAEGVGVSSDVPVLSVTTPRVMLTIAAAVNAMPGELTADADTAGLINVAVRPATLAVEILPRRFALRFETPEGAVLETAQVTAGRTTEVAVVLENADLLVPGETVTVPVTLTAETLSVVPPVVMLTEATPRAVLRIVAATTAMSGTLTAQADTADLMNAVVQPEMLAVTVLPAPVNLQLMFDLPTLTVAAGGVRTAVLRLLGDVPADAAVTVMLSTAAPATAQVVTESVTFTATTQSHAITIRGVAEGSATLTAMVDADALADLPSDSTVESAQLPVTVVPAVVDPVMLQLAFEPPTLTVAVGSEAPAMLRLLGDVPLGVAVTVDLSAPDAATARVLSEPVIFSAEVTSREVTVLGVAAGSVTITATVSEDALEASGLPAGSSVASTDLAVTVVLPTVDLQLAFDSPMLTVVAGSTATAVLRLEGVPATGAEVTVELSVADEATAEVTPAEVIFSEANPDTVVTLTGVAAGDATVTAVAVMLDGLSNASTVQSAQLAVTVVRERKLALGFETPEGTALETARVTAGSTTEVAVVLENADSLVPGETVTVPVTLTAEGMGVSVVPLVVTLTETTPRATLRIDAAANAMSGMLTAEVADDFDLPAGLSVAPAELPVTVTVVESPGLRLRVRVLLEGPLQ